MSIETGISYLENRVGLQFNPEISLETELDFRDSYTLPFPGKTADMARILTGYIVRDGSGSPLSIAAATGRGGHKDPVVFRWIGENPTNFSTVYLKGIGIADTDAALILGQKTANIRDFLNCKWNQTGIPSFEYQPGEDEVIGVAIRNDAMLDSVNSIRMHTMGLRVRLPIVTFSVNALPIDGKFQNLESLVHAGYPFDKNEGRIPTVSIWARRYPYSFRDLSNALMRTDLSDQKDASVQILRSLTAHMQFDSDRTVRQIAYKCQYLLNLNNPRALTAALSELVNWMAAAYGRLLGQMYTHGVVHGMLTDHNASPIVELSDNSTAQFYRWGMRWNVGMKQLHLIEHSQVLSYICDFANVQNEIWGATKAGSQKTEESVIGNYNWRYRLAGGLG
jgi:hypothetical protein